MKDLPEEIQYESVTEINRLLDRIEKTVSIVPSGKRVAGLIEGIGEFYMVEDFDAPLPDCFWPGKE